MKRFTIVAIFCLWMTPLIALAGWQVSTSQQAAPSSQPFFQANAHEDKVFTTTTKNKSQNLPFAHVDKSTSNYAISIHGSIKDNVHRLMNQYHWRVLWKVPYDYNFKGVVTGHSIPNLVENLFRPFPLQAIFYVNNRTMVVQKRIL